MHRRLLGLLLLLAMAVSAAPPPGIPDGWSDGYVYANDVRLHYYHAVPAPGKPVIVMAHGVTDNGLCWTTLAWELQDSYDIYMVDTRGHGLSDPFTRSDDGGTLVKDVVGFVLAMNFEKPILMGHSMGAATVMRVGAEYPDLAQAVIMLDPGVVRRTPGSRRGPPRAAATRAREREASAPNNLSFSMNADPEVLVEQNNYSFDDLVATCRNKTPKWDMVDCQYWALSKKQYHGAYSTETWQAMSGTMRTGDSLAKIPVPALVLKADTSEEARQANEEAAKVMQNGKLVHIDDAGHNLHHDDLQRTTEELTKFLATL